MQCPDCKKELQFEGPRCFNCHLEWASKVVDSWPEWKQKASCEALGIKYVKKSPLLKWLKNE